MWATSTIGAHTVRLDNVRPARRCHFRRIDTLSPQRSSQYPSLEASITSISTPHDVRTDFCALQVFAHRPAPDCAAIISLATELRMYCKHLNRRTDCEFDVARDCGAVVFGSKVVNRF